MNDIDTIIWDWNGTLLNDIDISIESMNSLLSERCISTLSKHQYRKIFTFPVRDYYEKAGFDFSSELFDQVAMEFIGLYHQKLTSARVFNDAKYVLSELRQSNIRQLIVSAMEHNALVKSVLEKGMQNYFELVSGIDDHYAASKLDNAKAIVNKLDLNTEKTCLIGDTEHDFDVAEALGVRCMLVADGHQSYERLKKYDCTVVNNLAEILQYLNGNKVSV